MNIKDKKRIILSLHNSNKNEKTKLLLKHLKRKSTSNNLIPPMKIINISTNPFYLKNLNIKHTVSIKKNKKYKTPDSTLVKINQSTNTLNSNNNTNNNNNQNINNNNINSNNNINNNINNYLTISNSNNNNININNNINNNIYNNNIYNKNICNYNYNEGNEIITPTIHSNGKFNNIKQLKNKIRRKLYEKNIIIRNNFINKKLNKNLFLKINDKNSFKDNWKGLNISSHYLGNTNDNRFGITSNKFYVNKNLVLTCSQNNLKIKQKYDTTSIILEKSDNNKNKEFKTINIPNHNICFNGIGTTNFFPRIENIINNEQLYKKLMTQMTAVFNSKIKEYSNYKSNERKSTKSSLNINHFRKNLRNIKKQKLFNYEANEIKNNNLSPSLFDRNDSFLNELQKFKTYENNKGRYRTINVKNKSKNTLI